VANSIIQLGLVRAEILKEHVSRKGIREGHPEVAVVIVSPQLHPHRIGPEDAVLGTHAHDALVGVGSMCLDTVLHRKVNVARAQETLLMGHTLNDQILRLIAEATAGAEVNPVTPIVAEDIGLGDGLTSEPERIQGGTRQCEIQFRNQCHEANFPKDGAVPVATDGDFEVVTIHGHFNLVGVETIVGQPIDIGGPKERDGVKVILLAMMEGHRRQPIELVLQLLDEIVGKRGARTILERVGDTDPRKVMEHHLTHGDFVQIFIQEASAEGSTHFQFHDGDFILL
jgi:hypothetical protein